MMMMMMIMMMTNTVVDNNYNGVDEMQAAVAAVLHECECEPWNHPQLVDVPVVTSAT